MLFGKEDPRQRTLGFSGDTCVRRAHPEDLSGPTTATTAPVNQGPPTPLQNRMSPSRRSSTGSKRLRSAEGLVRQGSAESRTRAIRKFKEALALWQQIGEKRKASYVLERIGKTYTRWVTHQNQ